MLEKKDSFKVTEEYSSSRLILIRKTKMYGVTRDKWRSRVCFPPFLSTLYTFRRPRFGLVKVTGSDGRLKIIKLENSNLVCYSTDRTPTVEMKHRQEDGDDHHQEEEGNDDENRNEETVIAKGITELLYEICSTEGAAGFERLSGKLKLMCYMINESSRLMSGWTKMWGVTADKMRSESTFPPTLHTERSMRRSRFDTKEVVVVGRRRREHGSLYEEMSINYRQDDDGNDGNNDDEEEVGNNNTGEEEEEKEEMVDVGGGGGGGEENRTDEEIGNCDQDDDGDDHGKNSKTKKRNNNKKNKKRRRKKT